MGSYGYRVRTLIILVILSLLISCHKDLKNVNSYSLSQQEIKAKEWLSENGGMFKHETLNLNTNSGQFNGKLKWDSTKEYIYQGLEYIEIPFNFDRFGSIVEINDTFGYQSFTVVIRKDSSGAFEGALRTITYYNNVVDISTGDTSIHNTQSYTLLDGTPSTFWYKQEDGSFLLGRRLPLSDGAANSNIKPLNINPYSKGSHNGRLMLAQPPGGGGGTTCITVGVPVTITYVVNNSGPEVIIGTYTYTEFV
ncbi:MULTISPECIES: hypothetical protein [Chitinophagaceae]